PATRFVADFLGESNLIPIAEVTPAPHGTVARSKRGLVTSIDTGARSPNAPVELVVIRPEHVVLGEAARTLPNQVEVEVTQVIYVGDLLKYYCVTQGGDEILVKALGAGAVPPRPGVRTVAGWPTEHCLPVAG